VWRGFFFGLLKITDPGALSKVIAAHGVLSTVAPHLSWLIPLLEMLVGLWIISTANSRRGSGHAVALGAGAAMLLAFAAYLAVVPEPNLKSAGCGCLGRAEQLLPTILLGEQSKARWIATDLAFSLLHALLAALSIVRRTTAPAKSGALLHSQMANQAHSP